ncbi:probable WRKY transcription factor 32 [Euphorbia lathyris]|uniref:probable WRKY transcription factor 32 n=1 Tax=Euphorbia lathyris TaxID=212925 RepID=UPI00331365F2
MADSEDKKDLSRVLYSNALPTYDFPSFSNLLKTVLTTNSPLFRYQERHETSTGAAVGIIKPKVARVQLKVPAECANPFTNASSLAPSEMPNPPPVLHKDMPGLAPDDNNTTPSHICKEMPATDGYRWRKYGEKQMKSSKSSRSYYRCSRSDCHAKKKVQHCDQSGHVIDVIYTGHHDHDITQNKRVITREPAAAAKLTADSQVDSAQKVDGADLSIRSEDSRKSSVQMGETEQHSSSSSNCNTGVKFEEQNGDKPELEKSFTDAEVQQKLGSEPGCRKRSNERCVHSTSVSEANRESKTVVHASADGVIADDGYRWRKYGQKMVKANSHSRSYYRCTSAGCTAHKHVERLTNDATETIITYVGNHDHDMPASKKQKVSKSLAPIPSTVTMDDDDDAHCKSAKSLSSQRITTKPPTDAEEGDFMDEKVLELGGEKALESARTLLTFSALN